MTLEELLGVSRGQRPGRVSKHESSLLEKFPTRQQWLERQRNKVLENGERTRYSAVMADLERIGEALRDPAVPRDEVIDLILGQMLKVTALMFQPATKIPRTWLLSDLRNLRLLQQGIQEQERYRGRRDEINVDGLPFQAALSFWLDLFDESMQQTNLTAEVRKTVMAILRDVIVARDKDLKRVVREATKK